MRFILLSCLTHLSIWPTSHSLLLQALLLQELRYLVQLIDKALVLLIRYRTTCLIREERCRMVRWWVTKGTLHLRFVGYMPVLQGSMRAAAPPDDPMHQSHYQPLLLSLPEALRNTDMHLPTYVSSASSLLPSSSLPNPTRLVNPKQFLQTSGLAPYRNETMRGPFSCFLVSVWALETRED